MTVKNKNTPDFLIPCFEDIDDAEAFRKDPEGYSGRIYYMSSRMLMMVKTSNDPNVTWVDFDRYPIRCTPVSVNTLMDVLRRNGYPSISLKELADLANPEPKKSVRPAFKPM